MNANVKASSIGGEWADTLGLSDFLRALPDEVLARLAPDCELVELKLGQVLSEASCPMDSVYFPTTAIVSILYVLDNKASAEIAIVGKEGMLGIFLFMSDHNPPSETVVQIAGQAYRLNKKEFKAEFLRIGEFFSLSLRYTQALITQMNLTAVCNRHHSLDQQLCRWLLLSLDRAPFNHLTMTHQIIANMLGVRRVGVTVAAGKLQAAGLIQYSRGTIVVLDRKGLENQVCECYQTVKEEFAQLLG
ncbi:MAG: Crp/Fnr family transcriptional regulator [Limnobacter sp.]|nr:Crp/Fnr family transcriptional regulator [Limnobacter sp.]